MAYIPIAEARGFTPLLGKYTYGKNSWYVVEEYAIVVLQYDEDEGWLNTGDICEITAMPKPEEWYER